MPKLCVEYAKSGRAKCTGCKQTILKNELRLGIEVQFPGGDEPKLSWNWRHLCCFTERQLKNAQAAGTLNEIEGYNEINESDKELVNDLKLGKLLNRSDLIGQVNDADKSSTTTKRKTKSSSTTTPKTKKVKKETASNVDLPSDNTENYEVDIISSTAPPCPRENCNDSGILHFQRYSHGPGLRPLIKPNNSS